MGEIDIAQMKFLRDPRHFADLWNGLAYGGEQFLDPENLTELSQVGLSDSGGRKSKKTADLVMAKTSDGQNLAVMILENQLAIDYSMPVRLILREAMEYDKQVSEVVKRNKKAYKKDKKASQNSGEYLYRFRMENHLKPVSTLVLYWNNDTWKGPLSLHDMIDFTGSEEMKPFVNDYRMNIINMDKVPDVKTRFMNQDVRNVISLFQRRGDKKGFKSYVDENGKDIDTDCMKMLNTLIKSAELKEYMANNTENEESDDDMCTAITELIADGKAEGRTEGRAEGMAVGRSEGLLIVNKLNAKLIEEGRFEDVGRASVDQDYQKELLKELFPEEYNSLVGTVK